ncbi:hypothetical protein ACHAW6_015770 [Cyclotella cf. meneghiniana]
MSSAVEEELGAIFLNVTTAIPIQKTLEDLGHVQPPTQISAVLGVVNNKIQPNAMKAKDMRFHWLKDWEV